MSMATGTSNASDRSSDPLHLGNEWNHSLEYVRTSPSHAHRRIAYLEDVLRKRDLTIEALEKELDAERAQQASLSNQLGEQRQQLHSLRRQLGEDSDVGSNDTESQLREEVKRLREELLRRERRRSIDSAETKARVGDLYAQSAQAQTTLLQHCEEQVDRYRTLLLETTAKLAEAETAAKMERERRLEAETRLREILDLPDLMKRMENALSNSGVKEQLDELREQNSAAMTEIRELVQRQYGVQPVSTASRKRKEAAFAALAAFAGGSAGALLLTALLVSANTDPTVTSYFRYS